MCLAEKRARGMINSEPREALQQGMGKHRDGSVELQGTLRGKPLWGWQTKELLESCQSQLQREPEREVKDKSREL